MKWDRKLVVWICDWMYTRDEEKHKRQLPGIQSTGNNMCYYIQTWNAKTRQSQPPYTVTMKDSSAPHLDSKHMANGRAFVDLMLFAQVRRQDLSPQAHLSMHACPAAHAESFKQSVICEVHSCSAHWHFDGHAVLLQSGIALSATSAPERLVFVLRVTVVGSSDVMWPWVEELPQSDQARLIVPLSELAATPTLELLSE
jgi:hypothetical protein